MSGGFKFFISILLIVAMAGIAFVGVSNANKTQKEKTSVITTVNDDIWSEIDN